LIRAFKLRKFTGSARHDSQSSEPEAAYQPTISSRSRPHGRGREIQLPTNTQHFLATYRFFLTEIKTVSNTPKTLSQGIRTMWMVMGTMLFACWCSYASAGQTAGDLCSKQTPPDLQLMLQRKFPEHRLPRESDNRIEETEANREHGGSECLGVGTGDFDGDGRLDYAVLLASKNKGATLLVAALRRTGTWEVSQLRTWSGERQRFFVAIAPPGTYTRNESLDVPPSETGEVEVIESTRSGIITGRTEASGIYYFLTGRGWLHVWVVD